MTVWKDKNILKQAVMSAAILSEAFVYNEKITLYPITIRHYNEFSLYQRAITINKNSRFPDKAIIKMSYLNFIMELCKNSEYGVRFNEPFASVYFLQILKLLELVCKTKDIVLKSDDTLYVNGCLIDSETFDDLRRIIIIQNDIDWDIDSFINSDTEKGLAMSQEKLNKNKDGSTLEDYIDSLSIVLHWDEQKIANLTIRKFWRYVSRINLRDQYQILKTGEAGGFVKFKEPIKHWMISINNRDKNENIKTDSKTVRGLLG